MIRFFLVFSLLILLLVPNGTAQIDTLEYSLSGDLPEAIVKGERTYTSEVIRLGRKHVLALPGSFDDPSRLLQSYPSMHSSNDQANSVIYRGQPSLFTTWSLNGSEIVNPNHLGNAGTRLDIGSGSSGGVNLFSGQILKAMEFRSLPYKGNHSGLGANMNMIIDNKGQSQYTFGQLSLLGAEAGFNRSSGFWNFLGNARYSTTGLLADMGVTFDGEEIRFRDFVFSLSKESRSSQFDITIASGKSSNFKPFSSNLEEVSSAKDALLIDYNSSVFISNINYSKGFKGKYLFKASTSLSFQEDNRYGNTDELTQGLLELRNSASASQTMLVSRFSFETTDGVSIIINHLNEINSFDSSITNFLDTDNQLTRSSRFSQHYEQNLLFAGFCISRKVARTQFFFQTLYPFFMPRPIKSRPLNYATYIKSDFQEDKLSIKIAAGQKYQAEPSIFMDTLQTRYDAYSINELSYFRSRNYEASISYKGDYNMSFSGFYNIINGLPYSNNSSFFYSEPINISSIKEWRLDGYRRSFGVESSIESKFSDHVFFNVNGSLFQSEIRRGKNAEWQNSFYNTTYSFNATASYLQKIGAQNSIRYSASIKQNGGFKELTIDPSKSNSLVTNTISNNTYTHLKPYSRIDFRINYTTKKSYWSLDIQNVLNTANEAFQFYDPLLESVETQNHLGLIPVLTYRRYFGKRIDG